MAIFTEPMNPAPMPDFEDGDPRPPVSAAVAESEVFAHQSNIGEDALNIEIDAPSGVTVRVHLNDGHLIEMTVP